MSKAKKYDSDEYFDNFESMTIEDYLKTLPLDDFLNNEKTYNILLDEDRYNYDRELRHKISKLYSDFNNQYSHTHFFLTKDLENTGGDGFADFIYNFLNPKYNLNIFYKDPELAESLFK